MFTNICPDSRPQEAIRLARDWANGNSSVGDARDASFDAHDAAREVKDTNKAACEAARSAGHAVATVHMADHALQAARYALKAIKNSSLSVNDELEWQNKHLPEEIKEFVLNARAGAWNIV